jgi:hypothetical protein
MDTSGFELGGNGGAPPPPPVSLCELGTARSTAAFGTLCGNGQRDAYTVSCGDLNNFGPCSCTAEVCDGSDLGGATCASLGYAQGQLGCSHDCMFDPSGCSACPPLDAHLVACKPLSSSVGGSLRVAASDKEIALAWTTDKGVSFQRLDADLGPVGTPVDLFTTPAQVTVNTTVEGVAAAPFGWAVAIVSSLGLEVDALDGAGKLLHKFVLSTASVLGGRGVSIAGQPSGGPLVAWRESGILSATIISADGLSNTTPVLPAEPAVVWSDVSTVFVGDAFLVAAIGGSRQVGIWIDRVLPDGSLDALPAGPLVFDPFATSKCSTGYGSPLLAADGGEVRVSLFASSGTFSTAWARLDSHGALQSGPTAVLHALGPAVAVAGTTDSTATPLPIAVVGDASLMAFQAPVAPASSAYVLDLLELGAGGALTTRQHVLNLPASASAFSVVRFGADVVVATPGFAAKLVP